MGGCTVRPSLLGLLGPHLVDLNPRTSRSAAFALIDDADVDLLAPEPSVVSL